MSDEIEEKVTEKQLKKIKKALKSDVLIACWVWKSNNKKKKEKRIIAVSEFRVVTFGKRKTGIKNKVLRNGHLFELKKLKSFDNKHLKLEFNEFVFDFFSDRADDFAKIILKNYLKTSVGFPQEEFLVFECEPQDRLTGFEIEESPGQGFIETYRAYCDYFKTNVNQPIIDYLKQNILIFKNDSRKNKLVLSKFKGISQKENNNLELKPFFFALKHNLHFKQVNICNVLNKEIFKQISETLTTNTKIEKLFLSNIGATEGFKAIGKSFVANSSLPLEYIDFSLNKIPESEITNGFAYGIENLGSGLVELDLSYSQLTPKSINRIFNALSINNKHLKLEYLNLSGSNFSKVGSIAFQKWAEKTGQNNNCKMLLFSGASLDLEIVCQSIAENFSNSSLKYIDLSKTEINKRNYISIATLIRETKTLKHLNISRTGAKPEAISTILTEILTNEKINGFCYNVSGNIIGIKGAPLIAESFAKSLESNSLEEFIIDDCKLTFKGFNILFEDTNKNLLNIKSLKKLSISRNISKGKSALKAIQSVNKIIKSKHLEYFRMRGDEKNHIGKHFDTVFTTFNKNWTLKALDLRGNYMQQDALIKLLGILGSARKVIQKVYLDKNDNSLITIEMIKGLIAKNPSLYAFEFPLSDSLKIDKSTPKKERKSIQFKLKEIKKDINEQIVSNRSNLKSDFQLIKISPDYSEKMIQKILYQHNNQLNDKCTYLQSQENQFNSSENQFSENQSQELSEEYPSDFEFDTPNELPTLNLNKIGPPPKLPEIINKD
ncbi:leucine-rich repeat [Anaeramoeba flamelloides]|uniref:Leucine-rich repeat n=1 Tax=Anaeramoeba flamelloides TaxID=1746091 RepID=A0AAV7Z798_9EUKA|nr:leucine-rich repeat isoform f [Anaeramoeba flamelloides]KAJ6226135.1 leucine-rich repeat [Anaeramoeba flamelloides]